MFSGNNKPNNSNNPSGMVLSELKMLKERNKVLENDVKLLRSRERSVGAVVPPAEYNKCRMALLNLLVAVENQYGQKHKPKGEMKKAIEGAEAVIRPGQTPEPVVPLAVLAIAGILAATSSQEADIVEEEIREQILAETEAA